MGAESILLLPKGEELIKWKQCSGGGGVCVCVCVRYREISHSWRGNPVLTTCQQCCVGVFVCQFCVCACVSQSKNASFEGMPEPLSEQIKTLNVFMISYLLCMARPSTTAASRGSKEITWLIIVVIEPILPVFSPRSALIYLDLPVGNGFSKPCQIDKLCLLFSVQLDNVDEQAAQIRRELDGRLQLAEKIARVRKLQLFLSLWEKHLHIADKNGNK